MNVSDENCKGTVIPIDLYEDSSTLSIGLDLRQYADSMDLLTSSTVTCRHQLSKNFTNQEFFGWGRKWMITCEHYTSPLSLKQGPPQYKCVREGKTNHKNIAQIYAYSGRRNVLDSRAFSHQQQNAHGCISKLLWQLQKLCILGQAESSKESIPHSSQRWVQWFDTSRSFCCIDRGGNFRDSKHCWYGHEVHRARYSNITICRKYEVVARTNVNIQSWLFNNFSSRFNFLSTNYLEVSGQLQYYTWTLPGATFSRK